MNRTESKSKSNRLRSIYYTANGFYIDADKPFVVRLDEEIGIVETDGYSKITPCFLNSVYVGTNIEHKAKIRNRELMLYFGDHYIVFGVENQTKYMKPSLGPIHSFQNNPLDDFKAQCTSQIYRATLTIDDEYVDLSFLKPVAFLENKIISRAPLSTSVLVQETDLAQLRTLCADYDYDIINLIKI